MPDNRILRVFPRRTAATPDDAMVRVGFPDLFPPECDEVHVSVTYTYGLALAEKLAEAWSHIAPTKIGGPALGDPGSDFVPGMYLKPGYTITSRGCPNRCWFCMAAKREGGIRELPIRDGWIVQDNNLLACSRAHIERVFEMLSRQPKRAVFSGGLEAKIMKPWVADALFKLNPQSVYFAYDTPDDEEPLAEAARMLRAAGFPESSHSLSAYVLVGYPKDTFEAAEKRLYFVLSHGLFPFAMLYRDNEGRMDRTWRKFQREWCRPAIVGAKARVLNMGKEA